MGSTISVAQRQMVVYRQKRDLLRVGKMEDKFVKVKGLLVERQAIQEEQLQVEIPLFRKRVLKAHTRLVKTLPAAEAHLAEAYETQEYLTDLRARLVLGLEKSTSRPYGANPSDAVLDGVRALEDGNPYSPDYKELEVDVQRTIDEHKKGEAGWANGKIKCCSEWLKQLKSLIRKLEANVEIGREVASRMQEIAAPLEDLSTVSVSQLHKLNLEILRAERHIKKLKEDRLRIEVAAAFADDLLLFKNRPSTSGPPMTKARARWVSAIKLVIEDNRESSKQAEAVQLQLEDETHLEATLQLSILRTVEQSDVKEADTQQKAETKALNTKRAWGKLESMTPPVSP